MLLKSENDDKKCRALAIAVCRAILMIHFSQISFVRLHKTAAPAAMVARRDEQARK